MYPVPKLLWLRKHRPDIFVPSVRFLSVIGYVLSRLGLNPYIDYSLASRYLAFDIRQHRWSEEILAAAEINAECLPVPVPAGTIAGKLDAAAAGQIGLGRNDCRDGGTINHGGRERRYRSGHRRLGENTDACWRHRQPVNGRRWLLP
jgi:sugar (pentulose or hexulose) kinase